MIEKPSKNHILFCHPRPENHPWAVVLLFEQGDSAYTSSMSHIQTLQSPMKLRGSAATEQKHTLQIDHQRPQTHQIHENHFSSKITHFAWTLSLLVLGSLPMD